MPKNDSSSSSQSKVSRFISMVRLALVTSVTCTPPRGPPVRFHSSQVSVVPNIASPRFGRRAHTVDVLQNPLQFAAGEIGRRRQARFVPDHVAAAVAVQRRRDAVGAGVLPDDRVVIRPAGVPVPHQRRLALIRDSQCNNVFRRQVSCIERRHQHRRGALPDLDRVVLDPSGARQDLLMLELMTAYLAAVAAENDAPGAGGALVDRSDELGQLLLLPRSCPSWTTRARQSARLSEKISSDISDPGNESSG